jgi:hypothetical protein
MGRTAMLVWLNVATVVLTGIGAGRYFVRYAKTKDKGSLVGACCFLVPCVIFFILALHAAGIIDLGWLVWSK